MIVSIRHCVRTGSLPGRHPRLLTPAATLIAGLLLPSLAAAIPPWVQIRGVYQEDFGASGAQLNETLDVEDPDGNRMTAGYNTASASNGTWRIQARSSWLQFIFDTNGDGQAREGAAGGATLFATVQDNFTVIDVTDPANPLSTGSMGATLFMNIGISGSLLVAGPADGGAAFSVGLFGPPTAIGSFSYGSAGASLSQSGGIVELNNYGISVPPGYSGGGGAAFDTHLRVNLCVPYCPQLGTPFFLKMMVSTGATVQAVSDEPSATLVEADFGNTFSISFEWDDPDLKYAISSEGGYSNSAPVPAPAALPLLLSALGVAGLWRRRRPGRNRLQGSQGNDLPAALRAQVGGSR